jgi:PAS domain S-box-containing protein
MSTPLITASPSSRQSALWWRNWWRRQTPTRQDRFAFLGPMFAVLLFLAAISAAFAYLRFEEVEREQEAVKRDVEYAQQRLRLRLLEQQEQIMRLARDVSSKEVDAEEFDIQAEAMIATHPELVALTWLDARRKVRATYASPAAPSASVLAHGDTLKSGDTENNYNLARDVRGPVYSRPLAGTNTVATLQLHVPMNEQGRFGGVVLAEYLVDGLLRYGIPAELASKYVVTLVNDQNQVLAGNTVKRNPLPRYLPWVQEAKEYEVPVSPVGNGLIVRAQAYRTSQGLIGSGLFWLVTALSILTAWTLVGTWRHTRRRLQTQQALVAETNFRRAMENSMLTGMRALDLAGRITYVNPAFCLMSGWSEADLVGRTAPFPYWPEEDREWLTARLEDELQGRTTPGGFEVRVKRKDGSMFDARMYVSPLIDAKGHQTGWMTSVTDITEPKRVREELSASYERFTTVLEGLDSAVSVAPLGSDELLFANKLYRQWFGTLVAGHVRLVTQSGAPSTPHSDESGDAVDSLAGLPIGSIVSSRSDNVEMFLPDLGKWLEVRARYLNWVDGRLVQMVIASDITARRHAEDLATQQADKAQSASRLITMGEMASSVAHELNQPLTAINNYCNGIVSRLERGNIDKAGMIEALNKTAKQAQRAGQIIQRIRSFVKRSEPNRSRADVATMLNNALELAEIELRRRNVRFKHYLASRLPALHVDPILIEQVLVNLIKNAAESVDLAHRPPSRRSVEVRVLPKMEADQPVVEFSVTDTGKGMAPEVMERLYEAFFSTKAEGMGIGLNLCRSIVESHQGRMSAENLYNGTEVVGCRFTFWLPVTQTQSTAADNAAKHGVTT